MTILDKIIDTKKAEVIHLKKRTDIEQLKYTPLFNRKCLSLKESLTRKGSSGIIAEFKQKSPSKGIINDTAQVAKVTGGYVGAGAAGLSVLTDSEYFGGSIANLVKAREANPETPVLRKEFIIDPIQIYEAKAFGADVILLIAACLDKSELHNLAGLAATLGLEVLVEVHNEQELQKISNQEVLIGVNNRDLKTFEVDIETSVRLGKMLSGNFIKISESGLSDPENIHYLRENGYHGFLIGETFMKTKNPAEACKIFISGLTSGKVQAE